MNGILWVMVKPFYHPPVFPDCVLPESGPSGQVNEEPQKPAEEKDVTPGAAKTAAAPQPITVMLDNDEYDVSFDEEDEEETSESEGEGEGSSSSESLVSSKGEINLKGKVVEGSDEEEATEEDSVQEREHTSKAESEKKTIGKGKKPVVDAPVASTPKKPEAPVEPLTGGSKKPFNLADKSAWTRTIVCAAKTRGMKRKQLEEESSEEKELPDDAMLPKVQLTTKIARPQPNSIKSARLAFGVGK